MRQNILGFQPKLLFVLKPIAEKKDTFGLGKTAPSGQWIAPVRAGQAHRHPERQAFTIHAGATGEEERQSEAKQRRGAGREKKQTQPRRKDAAALHLTELEGVSETLRGGTHVAVQAFSFLCFVVFQTSDISYHVFEPQ